MKEFQHLLQTFLADWLPVRRGMSGNTVAAYRDAFVLFLRWADSQDHIEAQRLSMSDLTPARIDRFAAWLRDSRGCGPSTCNARISAIKSFARFAQYEAPEHAETCRRVLEVPLSKVPRAEVDALGVDAVRLIVGAAAERGVRDHALVSLLYDSGCRVSEVCGLSLGDFRAGKPYVIRVSGKGREDRVVPISREVGGLVSGYIESMRPDDGPQAPLFTNRGGKPISRAGVAYVLGKCVEAAHAAHPDAVPARAHPHQLRHSKATHMLDDGVDLVRIRDVLGHESVTTTEIYARSSTKRKAAAVESSAAKIVPESPYGPEERDLLLKFLHDLT